MKLLKLLMVVAVLLTLSACEKQSPTAKAKDAVDDALDRRPGEKVRDAAEDAKDAVKDAAKDVKNGVKDAVK
jgi:hypothetical protein